MSLITEHPKQYRILTTLLEHRDWCVVEEKKAQECMDSVQLRGSFTPTIQKIRNWRDSANSGILECEELMNLAEFPEFTLEEFIEAIRSRAVARERRSKSTWGSNGIESRKAT